MPENRTEFRGWKRRLNPEKKVPATNRGDLFGYGTSYFSCLVR